MIARYIVVLGIVLSALCGGCGKAKESTDASGKTSSSTGKVSASDTEKAPASSDETSSSSKKKDTEQSASVEPVSRAYFGDLGLPRVERPVKIAPMKNGSVVLLVFDALNVRHLSAYGYKRHTSPNVDALAKQGLQFVNHVSNSSWTRPSFTTVITGQPKKVHGVELGGESSRLGSDVLTLAERFKAAGYRTAGLTGNSLVRDGWGFEQGFDYFEDPIKMEQKAFFPDRLLVERAEEWLDTVAADKPFFMVLFMTSSHPPYRPPSKPRRFLSMVPDGPIIDHPFKEYRKPLSKGDRDRIVAAYDDEVAYMDSQVGRLMKYLKSKGRIDNTVVAVTADHGEVFGLHNCYIHAYHMWEPALRVPWILKAPNLPVHGVAFDRDTTHIDIAPTLLDMVGISHDKEPLPGISMVDRLASTEPYGEERIRLSQYNAHGVRRQALRKGRWKLVHHHKVDPSAAERLDELHPSVKQPDPEDLPSLAWDKERFELYDLLTDPNENENLYETHRDRPETLELLAALKRHLGDKVESPEMSEEMIQALINAGYLEE